MGFFFGVNDLVPALDNVERQVGLEVGRAEGGFEVELQGQLVLELVCGLGDGPRDGERHICRIKKLSGACAVVCVCVWRAGSEAYSFRFGCWP